MVGGGEYGRGPIEALAAKPGGGELIPAIDGKGFDDRGLIGFGGGGGEGERDFA
jgi:hypothetical protein